MRRFWSLLVVTALVLAGGGLAAPAAFACSLAPTFVITQEHLQGDDWAAQDSRLAADYREWVGDESASIDVLGVYVYESVYVVEPDGDWSRGSLNVPVKIWGTWPDDTSPEMIEPEDRSGEPPTTCGWGPQGMAMGDQEYSVLLGAPRAPGNVELGEVDDATITAAFGAPDVPERDFALEQELIAQLDASRGGNTGLFVIGGVVALVIAGGVMFFNQRRSNDAPAGAESPEPTDAG